MSGIQVTIKPPDGGSAYSVTADMQDSVGMLKQYVLALGVLVQPYSAFSIAEKGRVLPNDLLLSSLVADKSATPEPTEHTEENIKLDLEMVSTRLTFADVKFQLEQVRDALGLGSAESTYVNGGATRLHEIKRGSKKNKKLSEDDLLELAAMPDAEPASVVKSLSDLAINNVTASEPNPVLPKPAAVELSFSKWQPLCRSPQLKLRGILAFIYFRANNGKEWHYVATPRGFAHVPKLTDSEYAEPGKNTAYVPALLQVIEQTSPATVSVARKNADKIKQDPLSCVPIPQVSSTAPWLVSEGSLQQTHPNVNALMTPEELTLRDWNEDFQTSREIQATSFAEKIAKDRSLCSTATEFASAALDGAMKIVEGSVRALNPDEELESSKLYLHNGIFYTHGSDFSAAYADIRTAEGARKAVKKGIKGVEQLMVHNNMELCPVLTAVVDYCGRSLVAQAPVPGIFREVPLIVYGLSEDHSQVHFDEKVDDLLKDFTGSLHLKKHPVNKEGLELQTSAEVHGAKSTDGRLYIIDLHRLFVPDLLSTGEELNLLRPEAVSVYYALNSDAPLLNPDVWMSPDNLPADYAAKEFPEDVKAAKSVASYVRESLVPSFVDSIASGHGVEPVDGVHLTSLLHRNGINMRLLGLVYAKAVAANLKNLSAVVLEEAIARSLKVILKNELEGVQGVENMSSIVEEFVAKLVSGVDKGLVESVKNRLQSHFNFELPNDWNQNLGRVSLLRLLALKCGLQFSTDLKLVAINPIIKYSFPRSYAATEAMEAARISLENAVVALAEKNRDPKEEGTESPEEAQDGAKAGASTEKSKTTDEETSETATEEELIEAVNQTSTILTQAVGIYTQVYGSSHGEVAHALNKVSTLLFEYSKDVNLAIEFSRKAITIAERVNGVDSYDVIVMYNNLAYFEQAAGNIGTSLMLSQHVISLYNELAWPGYKDEAALFSTVGTMLLQSGKPKLQEAAIPWLERAIALAKDTSTGPTGNTWFQLAHSQIVQQDYKNASRSMEAAYKVFKSKNGAEDSNTKEVKAYLEQLLKVTISSAGTNGKNAPPAPSTKPKKRKNKTKKSKSQVTVN